MPIRTNAYQSYKRCILIAQHNGQRDTPFSFYLSPSLSNIFPRRNDGNRYLYLSDFDGMFEKQRSYTHMNMFYRIYCNICHAYYK